MPIDGRQVTYGTYETESEAADAQARWRLTHRLPAYEVEPADDRPAMAANGVEGCDKWFGRWQQAKRARRSRVRVNNKRGGAESTAARDRACWSKWWAPTIGQQSPHTVTQRDITGIMDSMEVAGLAPLTVNTHWDGVKAFFNWLAEEDVIKQSPIAKPLCFVWARPDMQAPESFTLTSPAFEHGTPIPERHRGRIFGLNISPALAWTTPPAATAELVLIVQDPDVPLGKPATHALTLGIDPSLGGIPENGLSHPSPIPGLKHGKGAPGHRGWAGPKPPRSHGPHSYVFQLFALDNRLDLPDKFTLADVLRAMGGRVIARARLDGTYEVR